MTDSSGHSAERELVAEVREDLAVQFVRVARAERPRRNRWLVFGVIAGLVLVPGSFAAAELLEQGHTIQVDGEVTRVDGEIIDCPAEPELVAELGLDPCDVFKPAPAPLDTNPVRGQGEVGVGKGTIELAPGSHDDLDELAPSAP